MCLVEIEKTPKLQAACTMPVAEGMVVRTDSPLVAQARKSMLEFLLTNHPLDCPVCDKGGECELQDMVFRYGAGESRYTETKLHVDEKQWSPVVFFDAPRCILCYRCVRVCNEGMGVGALGVVNRGVISEIAPNEGDHLNCDECGACIDICPVGALTSGTYRYQTRPWEMNHVGTICTHCSNGCKTTLGVRNDKIIRGNNRDRSGINGEFLCIKGRYAFDFTEHPERLQSPLMRVNGKLEPVSWSQALLTVAREIQGSESPRRQVRRHRLEPHHQRREFLPAEVRAAGAGHRNIDHHRSGDLTTLLDALSGKNTALATVADLYTAKAVLVVGADLARAASAACFPAPRQFPPSRIAYLHSYRWAGARAQICRGQPHRASRAGTGGGRIAARPTGERTGTGDPLRRFHQGRRRSEAGRFRRFAGHSSQIRLPGGLLEFARRGGYGPVPGLLPGYHADPTPGLALDQMLSAPDLDVLWVVGANPLNSADLASQKAFVVVQEMFLTETAERADIVSSRGIRIRERRHRH